MLNPPEIGSENNARRKHGTQRGATAIVHRAGGPRTPSGKMRSSRNALKSGIFSKAVLFGTESRAEYESLLNGWLEDLQPQGTSETVLVEDLVTIVWRRQRLLHTEGAALHEIGRVFDKPHSCIRSVLLPRGGISPTARRRSRPALTLSEREDISRGIASGSSIREIARHLDRAASTVSREIARHGGRPAYRAVAALSYHVRKLPATLRRSLT